MKYTGTQTQRTVNSSPSPEDAKWLLVPTWWVGGNWTPVLTFTVCPFTLMADS